MIFTHVRCLFLLILAAGVNCPASAQTGYQITPVIIEINAARQVASVTFDNATDKPLTVQASSMSWTQDNGVDKFGETDDLLVVPAIITIGPKSKQVFRVAMRNRSASTVERTYRLIFDDITPAAENGNSQVALKINHNLPVLVAPAAVRNSLSWMNCESSSASAKRTETEPGCLRVENNGTRRVKIAKLLISPGQGLPGKEFQLKQALNILAGSVRDLYLTQTVPSVIESVKAVLTEGEEITATRVAAKSEAAVQK